MSSRNRRPSSQDAFRKLPPEMYFKIFSFLDVPSLGVSRRVAKRWKMLVDTSQRQLHYTCDLCDESLATAARSNETFASLRIHDFLGKENRIVSATRGTGKLFANADVILLVGGNIESSEIKRMIPYAVRTVVELSFQSCTSAVLAAVFQDYERFNSLTKLTLAYKSFPTPDHTAILESFSNMPTCPVLPFLEHLKLCYELDHIEEVYEQEYNPSANHVFANYLATARAIVTFRRSLKTVEISRNEVLRTSLVLRVDTTQVRLSLRQRRQIAECISAFESVQLETLHVTPFLDEGDFPWTLETSLVQNQRELKVLTLDKKLCFPRPGSQFLRNVFPSTVAQLTSVKVSLTCLGTEPVDLALFSECPQLTTLWLTFYRGVQIGHGARNTLHFTNLDRLPRQISSLHFKSSQADVVIIHQQSILNKSQIQWIFQNMKALESLWLQLVMEEPVQEEGPPPPPLEHEHSDEDEEAEELARFVRQHNQEVNTVANVDLQTFRNLISLPRIKELKFDMLKAGQLDAVLEMGEDGNPWIRPRHPMSFQDIQEYTQACAADPTLTCISAEVSFFPFQFIELTVLKKK